MSIHQLSASEINEKFLDKTFSAEEITHHFLSRIHQMDEKVGSFISIAEEKALKKAIDLDKRLAAGDKMGKLAAVPIGIKDNIHVEGLYTTCGSKFLKNFKAPFNSTVVERFLNEDAIIIGKTNLDEFAMGSSTEHSAYKVTHNPWNLACTPGGSSGGSAACVAARFAPITLGSDTGGSIRQPGSLCGVVGFKPTYGMVSRWGLVAYGSSLDVIGPLTTNVKDSALVMDVIAGHDTKDATSIPESNYQFLKGLDTPPAPFKVGVPWHFLEQLADEPKQLFLDSIEKLKRMGAEIVEIDLDIMEHSLEVYYIIATAEASTNLARFDGIRYGIRDETATTLDEIYNLSKEHGYGEEVKRRIMLGTFVLSSGHKNAFYRKAQKIRTLMIEKFNQAFRICDLIATPVSPFGAFELGSIKDPIQMYLEDIYTIGANLAGIPGISVPAAFTSENKPMGLQLLGPHKSDPYILKMAYHFEQACKLNPKMPEWVL
ncbi:Asp-tRNA(Asn)/Glu-tRNA(Gln) amidotransferase subunit GatA [Chlamydiales bacterium]|nr:Asp-tRNA(Asn)/Glu-tRNA(Gln) amidotransferase subunit GatA [Chlamydiales bacterium]